MTEKQSPCADELFYDYCNSHEPTAYEDTKTFKDQHVEVLMPKSTMLWFMKNKWNFPDSRLYTNETDLVAAKERWEAEREAFLHYGESIQVEKYALLCGTFYKYGTSYLVKLFFTGPDKKPHEIKVYMSATSKDEHTLYAKKIVDGVPCSYVYNSIVKNGYIEPRIASKLHSCGSAKWEGTAEHKTQYKLNSWKQSDFVEGVASKLPNIILRQLDKFDDYLYKGDPGSLGDYDLIIKRADGSEIKTRIDLKLLMDLSTLPEQNAHDAELLIATDMDNSSTIMCKYVKIPECNINLYDVPEFRHFMQELKNTIQIAPPKYIKIIKIDETTGKVDFSYFQ